MTQLYVLSKPAEIDQLSVEFVKDIRHSMFTNCLLFNPDRTEVLVPRPQAVSSKFSDCTVTPDDVLFSVSKVLEVVAISIFSFEAYVVFIISTAFVHILLI